jgi:hypothetical protein
VYLHPAIIADLSEQIRAEHIRRASRWSTRRARRRSLAPRAGPSRQATPLRRFRLLRA